MSYLALARKWRPTKFKEVVGQSHVLTALENALAQNRLHHAYLFSGTRGVGKTSIGRLFAKGLNCETGITAEPCGQCSTCQEIDQGRFVDLLEIDAASRTKVEDTRELLDNVQYKPARGRFKVYLIDEVHMLSRHSFNALLKTLEEPPEYVKFLLATTDPQKLPVTILSRCLQFHLKPISIDDIHHQLEFILGEESVHYQPRALSLLAHAADGSMRDALSLTDQAIALGNGEVLSDSVANMLGTIDTDQALHLLQALSTKQPQQVMTCVEGLATNGVEWDNLLQELLVQLHRLGMYQLLPSTLDKSQPDAEKVQLLSQALSPEEIQLFYQIAIKGRNDLPLAPTARIGLEMVLLRMIAFKSAPTEPFTAISTASATVVATAQPQIAAPVIRSTSDKASLADEVYSADRAPSADTTQRHRVEDHDVMPEMEYNHVEEEIGDHDYPDNAAEYYAEPSVAETPPVHVAPPITQLRHQLRSQRMAISSEGKDSKPKKPKAASEKPDSVMDRLKQRHHNQPAQMPELDTDLDDELIDEPYQWRPSVQQDVVVEANDVTPTQLKQALEHEKTAEMMARLISESVVLDEWSELIQQLDIAKLLEQLALNSAYTKRGNYVELNLRPHQAHLNTDKAHSELQSALQTKLGSECQLTIIVSDLGTTPLELRESLYQQKLTLAKQSLDSDETVQFLLRRFQADLDAESIRPI
jgi:DNA polymerase III subunit gamma/tau